MTNVECRMTKEARMTNYRKPRIETQGDLREEEFWQEAKELHLIFSKIWRK